jgi:acetylornithine deacetylase/succinyl-diaminopimelate desuccinylase-like protein
MSRAENLISRLRAALNNDAAIARLTRLVRCASVTGHEGAVAELLAADLHAIGAEDVMRWDFLPGRANVRGFRHVASDRPTVLLVGHTDTVHVRGWGERWAGTDRADPFSAAVVDGELWGRGSADMKIGIATAISAVELLDRARIAPACNIQFAFVGDEESGEPGSGVSAGMKALMPLYDEGLWGKPDFAIYGEPSSLDVYPAHMGFFICDIVVTGKSAYFGLPEQGVDALKAGSAVLSALWLHSDDIRARAAHPVIGPGFLIVTSAAAGGYIAVPGECRISLIRKLIPGEDLEAARQSLEAVARAAIGDDRITIGFNYPAGRDHSVGGTPLAIDPETSPIGLFTQVIRNVRPDAGQIGPCAGWSEGPFLAARGIPVVYFSPGDFVHCHTLEERVGLNAYADGIVALAAFLATYGLGPV